MRKCIWLLGLVMLANLLATNTGLAQPGDSWTEKVVWSFKVVKVDDNHADIVATAKLIEHWHVYAISHDPSKADFTGVPASFTFVENSNYRLVGKTKDGKTPHEYIDDMGTSMVFEGTGVFKQRIEVLNEDNFEIDIEYSFQICDENGCLFPPEQEATVKISGYTLASNDELEAELKVTGDTAKDDEGNSYVKLNEKWIVVPEGNSINFYIEYLKLGGSYE